MIVYISGALQKPIYTEIKPNADVEGFYFSDHCPLQIFLLFLQDVDFINLPRQSFPVYNNLCALPGKKGA